MEKIIVYGRLLFKDVCKKKTTWISVAGMIFLVFLIHGIQIPSQNNMRVGIIYGTSTNGRQIEEFLQRGESVFEFQNYSDADLLREDVAAGKLVCGFVLPDHLDEKMEEGDLRDSILYLTTPIEVRGEVAKETFYAAFLSAYSDELMRGQAVEIYGEQDAERQERLQKEMERLLQNDEVFQTDHEYRKVAGTDIVKQDVSCYPVQGIQGILILLFMFLAEGDHNTKSVERVFYPKERLAFRYIRQLAFAVLPALTAVVCIFFCGQSRGILTEIMWMSVLVLYGGIWNLLLAGITRNGLGMVSGILVRIILMILICPVFVDFSKYVPAVKYIRNILPLGIYLI